MVIVYGEKPCGCLHLVPLSLPLIPHGCKKEKTDKQNPGFLLPPLTLKPYSAGWKFISVYLCCCLKVLRVATPACFTPHASAGSNIPQPYKLCSRV